MIEQLRFPLTALVGIDDLKLALLLNAIDPKIGGVLIRGDKGTAKSTAVRGLSGLLPKIEVYEGDVFNCGPGDESFGLVDTTATLIKRRPKVVDLPIGTTEDRVTGTLDLERTLRTGERHFEPGLLADAHRGVLYIDEVNLLPDHLVDLLLDVAASGVNVVEREGNSIAHPSRFVLVGTMNPEEGELRPQLLDRFGLMVGVKAPLDPTERAEVVRRRISFDNDPATFSMQYASKERQLADRLQSAQERLESVEMPDAMLHLAIDLCLEAQVDGMRPDITIYRSAATLAAFDGRTTVIEKDIYKAALLVLPHRQRRRPLDQQDSATQTIEEMIDSRMEDPDESDTDGSTATPQTPPPPPDSNGDSPDREPTAPIEESLGEGGYRAPDHVVDPAPRIELRLPPSPQKPKGSTAGRDKQTVSSSHGRVVRHRQWDGHSIDIAPLGTLIAAVTRSSERFANGQTAVAVRPDDIRMRERVTQNGRLVHFLIDGSGSMGARERMRLTKAATLSLLQQRYEQRDKVAIQVFRDDSVELVLKPTSSIVEAARLMRSLPTGGRTPLALALRESLAFIRKQQSLGKVDDATLVIITDARSNDSGIERAAESLCESDIETIVIDTESGFVRLGRAKWLSEILGGGYVLLSDYESVERN